MDNIKQPNLSVFSQIGLHFGLKDRRGDHPPLKFGTVEQVCRQYGIKYRQLSNCIEFYAPKLRMQCFIEKLHFARMPYSYSAY
jgi:hypothetical protein